MNGTGPGDETCSEQGEDNTARRVLNGQHLSAGGVQIESCMDVKEEEMTPNRGLGNGQKLDI